MYIVKLMVSLDSLGQAGDLVVAKSDTTPKEGDFVIAEQDGRRVVREWQPGIPWLATVIHVIT